MFDADTVRLIARAPALEGVNLEDLPRQLTSAYAAIVAARIRLRANVLEEDRLPSGIVAILNDMRRLAFTHEALVSASGNRENRSAAAFVAGAAHHITLMAEKVRDPELHASELGHQSISPEISAALLFLIAEASADAAEMAKAIIVRSTDPIERVLLLSIDLLAHGRLEKILELPIPVADVVLVVDSGAQAVRALYYLLLQGVRALATSMLGQGAVIGGIPLDPREMFEHVKGLCIEPLGDIFGDKGALPYSVYPGPWHLASLLSSVSMDLPSLALVNVPPPGGVDAGRWLALLQELAAQRPYLWFNHRQAISAGYLETGVSAAISFPTGAGKSTLSELKIAAALLRGVKVVFLAPTLALVDQTARALTASFPKAEVQREKAEELLFDFDGDALPTISVMTPERCLAILSFDREVFAHVGLMVFDECHLLHPKETDRSRRAIDAMLCVLNFTAVAPGADLLFLSAMMSNCVEIAGWLENLTGRPCLPLALTWKPTRQVRGCVVYGEADINALKGKLTQARTESTNKDAPATLKRSLQVRPFGFFCLHQTWQSKARRDYSLIPLLDELVTLSTATSKTRNWYLTPNGNQVAAVLAGAVARQRLKTLVFTQTITLANSASSAIARALGAPGVTLNESERLLYAAAVEEAGGREHVYIDVNTNGGLLSSSACHHGLLLPTERHLHESLFRRQDGIFVLVATSTLAQGMNLPSEVVIIGGDSRFDPEADRMQKLEAHELLNAAGRAGRAGESAYGFVLVVPSKVVHFNNEKSTIHSHWSDLQAIFAQSDQCLVIDDPLQSLLDQIHSSAAPLSDLATYLIRRLPAGASNEDNPDEPAQRLLGKSFAAYRARTSGDENWIRERIEAVLAARRADPEAAAILTWADRLAAAAGVPVAIVRSLGDSLSPTIDRNASVQAWYKWVVDWLTANPALVPQLIRRESLESLFGAKYKALADDSARGLYAAPLLFPLLDRWTQGGTLADLERAFGTKESKIGKCETAREFALRVVPELAYIFNVPVQVLRAVQVDRGEPLDAPVGLASLGSCVKEGFDRVEKLALRQYRKGQPTRVGVHRDFLTIEPYLAPPASNEDFAAVISRVENAVSIASLI
jgi:superfamily II DNA/RNA helicase